MLLTCRFTLLLGSLGAIALIAILGVAPVRADYVTPGLGNDYNLDHLVTLSGGAVTGAAPQYQIHESVVITVSDTLTIDQGTEIAFVGTDGSLRLEINGSLIAHGALEDSVRFTSLNMDYGDYDGIDFRDTGPGSIFEMMYCIVEYTDNAIDVVYADVLVEHCLIQYSGSKAIDLTGSNSTISHCTIRDNYKQTIYMTLSSSPTIQFNWIEGNNIENVHPYPFINIGLQGVNSPTIRDNTIIGGNHMSGGIAIWNECHGIIENNYIQGCGYGILCYQFDANPLIKDNTLHYNNIHPDTVNWGFGIACNGQNEPIITGNSILGHYYGVALINSAQPNLGDLGNADPTDDGLNYFEGNGLGGEQYELYNNTNLDIMAENNWWGTNDPLEIEDRIVHSVDDPSLGTVDFEPFVMAIAVDEPGDGDALPARLEVRPAFPNPFNPATNLTFSLVRDSHVRVRIFDAAGQKVRSLLDNRLGAGNHSLTWRGDNDRGRAMPSGVYFWRITAGGEMNQGKLVLVRGEPGVMRHGLMLPAADCIQTIE